MAGSPEIIDWLLESEAPVARHLALRDLVESSPEELAVAQAAAMAADPIRSILSAQTAEGYWVKPGGGYSPKYTGTVWQLIFLDQLGADPGHPQVRAAGEYILEHTQAVNGGFSYTSAPRRPPPSGTAPCLHGNLLAALLHLGFADDPRVRDAIRFLVDSETAAEGHTYYQSGYSGPKFSCAVNGKQPCGWGGTKAVIALASVPAALRTPAHAEALQSGVEFLLSVDPATALYPMTPGTTKPSGTWFKLGFPLGYVADVLQVMEAICEAGCAADPRLEPAVSWLLAQRDKSGPWLNKNAYHGKLWVDFEQQGAPSKLVTIRALRVLQAICEANG